MRLRRSGAAVIVAAVVLLVSACAPEVPGAAAPTEPPTEPPTVAAGATPSAQVSALPPTGAPAATAAAATPVPSRLASMIDSTPYPYTTPLPALTATTLDGVFSKIDPKQGTPVPCTRCADYKLEGGEWLLWFDRGIFRVSHPASKWRTVGSFTLSGDQLLLFNDPTCHTDVGRYTWTLEGGTLRLKVVDDPCAIGLRAKNLTAQPWTR